MRPLPPGSGGPGRARRPLAPAPFDLGVDVLSGLVVTDPEGVLLVVAEGGSVAPRNRTGRLVMLQRNMTLPGE